MADWSIAITKEGNGFTSTPPWNGEWACRNCEAEWEMSGTDWWACPVSYERYSEVLNMPCPCCGREAAKPCNTTAWESYSKLIPPKPSI